MKPTGPEQTQDTHEHDYISLFVSNLKKYKRMKSFGRSTKTADAVHCSSGSF
ncbi:MAG: hypothetical protein MI975_05365 [Cytophagales bacterium]|nr:hypothetical protein [Cytophagales bacterium]